ncbi:MAG: hypothetical protein AAF191_19745 [Verrucomicrobiota bacterium]
MAQIGVEVGRETRIAVPHQSLRQSGENPLTSQFRGKGVAQGVEIDLPARGIDDLDSRRLEVALESSVGIDVLREHRIGR